MVKGRKIRSCLSWVLLGLTIFGLTALASTALASTTTTTLDKTELDTSVGKRFVLLLHGARFSSLDWKKIGTEEIIKDAGFTPVAVDLKKDALWAESPEKWMKAKMEELEATGKVVVVSPSMSGRGALPYVIANSASVLGFVPIAPSDPFPEHKLGQFHNIKTQTLILFGATDERGKAVSKTLEGVFDNHRVVEIEEAGHACYLDQPEKFHEELQKFLRSLARA